MIKKKQTNKVNSKETENDRKKTGVIKNEKRTKNDWKKTGKDQLKISWIEEEKKSKGRVSKTQGTKGR